MSDTRPRWIAAAFVALCFVAASGAGAQNGLPLIDDASMMPRGLIRLRTQLAWTRYDLRFANPGVVGLGDAYTSDALGASKLAPLGVMDSLIAVATDSAFTLSLGKSRLDAMAREEHLPFVLEYGLLRRLSVSVTVPVIRKRLSGQLRLDSAGANVGPNPGRLSATAASTNAAVQSQITSAVAALQAKLTSCNSNPAGAGCATLLPRAAEAQTLILQSSTLGQVVTTLYGTSLGAGQRFVPRSSSAAHGKVVTRLAAFNAQYKDLLSEAFDRLTALPAGAAGPAGAADLTSYVEGELGRDSLASDHVFGVGDVEIGAKYLVFNRPDAGFRLLAAASVSLPTGTRRAPVEVADLRIANGAIGFDVRGIAEWRVGRAALTATGSAKSLGKNSVMPAYDSRIITSAIEPRFHVTDPLEIHGSYALRNGDLSGNAHFVGGGVSFTTISSYKRGDRPLPMEMRYTHLEAVRGAVGAEKFTRDQVEVRVYYSLGRH